MSDVKLKNDSTTLQVEDLTDAKLLEIATGFDAGPMPIVNGQLHNPDMAGVERYHVSIEWRSKGWAIVEGTRSVLTKQGRWEFEPLPSSRTDAYYRRARFTTHLEAFAFYFQWRNKMVEQHKKEEARKAKKIRSK